MSKKSRNKGAGGERELIRLIEDETGIRLQRNLAQTFGGGHDLIGLDQWAIECKRYASISNADKAQFWRQAVAQAIRVDKTPAVCFRADRQDWRVLVPYEATFGPAGTSLDLFDLADFNCSCEISMELFCGLLRETL